MIEKGILAEVSFETFQCLIKYDALIRFIAELIHERMAFKSYFVEAKFCHTSGQYGSRVFKLFDFWIPKSRI